jgi:hypothetical protein
MAFGDDLQRRIENAALYFQGGVRRSILIFGGIILILLTPVYFLGQLSSSLWKQFWYDETNMVNSKVIEVAEYTVSETEIVPLADGNKDLYVSVSNKRNQDIGFFPWNYTIQILNGTDQILSQERVSSFLLPDETKFIVARSEDPTAQKIRITEESGTQPTLYNPNSPTSVVNPDIEVRQEQLTVNEDGTVTVFAQFKNNDIVRVERVNVLYIIRDTRQAVVGIGTVQFSGFFPEDIRNFEIDYPAPADREPRFLDLRWNVNYLDNNIVRRV